MKVAKLRKFMGFTMSAYGNMGQLRSGDTALRFLTILVFQPSLMGRYAACLFFANCFVNFFIMLLMLDVCVL